MTTIEIPVVLRLHALADEFERAATHYGRLSGRHNALLRDECRRARRQLRTVAERVRSGKYSADYGAVWLKAAWRIICAVGRKNLA